MSGEQWAAWAAVLAALLSIAVSMAVVYWQFRKSWLLHSAVMMTSLLEQFEATAFAESRRRCGELAARHVQGEQVSLRGNYGFGIFGFFEHIGHLLRRGALDEELVWNRMGWEIVGYWEAFGARKRSLILELREAGKISEYCEFEWLHRRMLDWYFKAGDRVYDSDGTLVWMKEFLASERGGGPRGHVSKSSPRHTMG